MYSRLHEERNVLDTVYNNSGKHCLLAEEACVSAELSDGFSMMILRTTPYLQCLDWMTFNRNYGNKYGYPKRAVQTPMQRNRMAAVARAFIDGQLLIGRSTTYRYKAYVLDSQQNQHQISGSYDILVVEDACSTAWVPYSAGEPIPAGAVVVGEDELFRARYIVGPNNSEYLYFSTYIYGKNEAHYSTEDDSIFSFSDMFMLVALA